NLTNARDGVQHDRQGDPARSRFGAKGAFVAKPVEDLGQAKFGAVYGRLGLSVRGRAGARLGRVLVAHLAPHDALDHIGRIEKLARKMNLHQRGGERENEGDGEQVVGTRLASPRPRAPETSCASEPPATAVDP